MRCIAVLVDIDTPDIDTVILWEHDGQLVAYAYLDAQITRRRPLTATHYFDEAITEVQQVFGIGSARITRIQEWVQVG